MIRIDKFLCDMEIGSRSQVKDYIKKGQVAVNGVVVKSADSKIDENRDEVTFQGRVLSFQKFHYYLLHKPAGVITATKDGKDKTVMDLLIGAEGKNLSPVGRLDKDTEGLLLITNDGALSHNLLSPKKHVDKTYYVECEGFIDKAKIRRLEEGIDIGDEKPTLPSKVKLLAQKENTYQIELTIHEGRFHQVKRMIEAVNGKVTYLKRLSFGTLVLEDSLPKGAYRALTKEEIAALSGAK